MNVRSVLLRLSLALAGAMCMAPGCDGDVLSDSTFRLWCGDTLCDWRLDTGQVKQASTWHPDDYGVELVDAPTQISQESSEGAPCMEFSAVADVEAASQTKVLVDWNLDGVTDFEAPVAETHWGRTSTLVFAPDGWGDKLRFFIRKDTAGHSVLAEIRLRVAHTCAGTRPTLRHVASGNACAADAECESGTCVRNQAPRGKCQ